ncbi:MAG: hypothetical protein IPL91_14525 [Hyphomicrobium sp.]|nr:hypothetical protein [Hyphomicrobium sp.]
MGRLVEFRDAVTADFKAFLPEVKSIDTHFGPFDMDELKTFIVRAPAVRVSIVGSAATSMVATREVDVQLHCAAFIVTQSLALVPADVAALDIAEALVGRLAARPFTGFSEVPEKIKIENHYSGAVRGTGGIALFSVDWHQVVRVGLSAARARYDAHNNGGAL